MRKILERILVCGAIALASVSAPYLLAGCSKDPRLTKKEISSMESNYAEAKMLEKIQEERKAEARYAEEDCPKSLYVH